MFVADRHRHRYRLRQYQYHLALSLTPACRYYMMGCAWADRAYRSARARGVRGVRARVFG